MVVGMHSGGGVVTFETGPDRRGSWELINLTFGNGSISWNGQLTGSRRKCSFSASRNPLAASCLPVPIDGENTKF